ncbi:IS110 family transposase [Nakamurella sp. A5-74]|uniref:IS110 family transposase n=1 Tax=Nakamurella sp. A5-74 TaxID=3158264 RepID=A0AAU8DWJ3_9ACTN
MTTTSHPSTEGVQDRRWAGIDWSSTDHAVCIIDEAGTAIDQVVITHDAPGLRKLIKVLLAAGVEEVGIERGDGPVVEALLQAELTVLVIPPSQVKNLRSRYRSAGNKDDRYDAFVLADTIRTDRARLTPLQRDSAATGAMRTTTRARRNLVAHRIAVCNQLAAHLHLVFPGAAGLFSKLDSPISLQFLTKFTTQTDADKLTERRLASWLKHMSYSGGTDVAVLHERLTTAARGVTGPQAATHAATTRAYVAILQALITQIAALETDLAQQLTLHPDTAVFASLPRVKTLRIARLIGEIGDARGRFPTPDALAALAGVVPSTRQSGKVTTISFRFACNRELRDALCDFADGSRHANPWAEDTYRRAIARGHDHPHAIRVLARAWTKVIWRCWQNHEAYNPTKHGALQKLTQQQAA